MNRKMYRILTLVFLVIGIVSLTASYGISHGWFAFSQSWGVPPYTDSGYVDDSGIYAHPSTYKIADGYYRITYLFFSSSSIPSDATIIQAKLILDITNLNTNKIYIYHDEDGVYPHRPLTSNENQYVSAGMYESRVTNTIHVGANTINLPASWINKDGFTKMALRVDCDKEVWIRGWDLYLMVDYIIEHKYTLTVVTNPSYCQVTCNGETKNSGTSGAIFYNLAEGSYQVTVSKDGYITKTQTVYMDRDKSITVTLEPETHQYLLTVHTNPNYCNVQVGQYSANSGQDGKCSFTLDEGQYIVTVSKDGYESQSKSVNLDSDKDVYFTLQQTTHQYTLTVHVTPVGSTVEVSGETKIVPPSGYVEFTLEEGQYTVNAYKEGYTSKTVQVILDSNKDISIELTPETPVVDISSTLQILGLAMFVFSIPTAVLGWKP